MGCSSSKDYSVDNIVSHQVHKIPPSSSSTLSQPLIDWRNYSSIWFYHPQEQAWVPAVIKKAKDETRTLTIYPVAGFESYIRDYSSLSVSLMNWRLCPAEPRVMKVKFDACMTTRMMVREKANESLVYALGSYAASKFDPNKCPQISYLSNDIELSLCQVPSCLDVWQYISDQESHRTFSLGEKVDVLVENFGIRGWTVGVIYRLKDHQFVEVAVETPKNGVIGIQTTWKQADGLFPKYQTRSYNPKKLPQVHQRVLFSGQPHVITDVYFNPDTRVVMGHIIADRTAIQPVSTIPDWQVYNLLPPKLIYQTS